MKVNAPMKLEEICEFINGGTPPRHVKEYYHGTIPWVTSADINDDQINFGRNYINKKSIAESSTNLVAPGTVLLVTRTGVGKVVIADRELCFSQDITAISPDPKKIRGDYLAYFLKSKMAYFKNHQRGATIKGITREVVSRLQPFLPVLEKQEKIVSILKKTEFSLEERREAIGLLDNFLESTFVNMFNRKDYPKEKIEKFIIDTEIIDPSRKPTDNFFYVDIESVDSKEGVIKGAKELTGAEAPSRARKRIKKEDVLVSTVRPNLNATALVPENLDNQVCSTGFAVLRCSGDLRPAYLYMCTRLNFFIAQLVAKTKGASYPAVSNQDVLDTKIPFPPIEEQKKFEAIFLKVQQIKRKMRSSEAELQNLFNCLMQKAFKGELFNA